MRAPWTSTLFRVNGKSAEMGWLMMAPLARPRRAQRQEVAQGGDEIAPTVDVGVAVVVGGHALDLRHGRQLRVQDRQIGLPPATGAGPGATTSARGDHLRERRTGPRRAWRSELPFGCLRIVPQVVRQLADAQSHQPISQYFESRKRPVCDRALQQQSVLVVGQELQALEYHVAGEKDPEIRRVGRVHAEFVALLDVYSGGGFWCSNRFEPRRIRR